MINQDSSRSWHAIRTTNTNAGSPKGLLSQCLMPKKYGHIKEPLIGIGGRIKGLFGSLPLNFRVLKILEHFSSLLRSKALM